MAFTRRRDRESGIDSPCNAVELNLCEDDRLYLLRRIRPKQCEASHSGFAVGTSDTVEVPMVHNVCAVVQRCQGVDALEGWRGEDIVDIDSTVRLH